MGCDHKRVALHTAGESHTSGLELPADAPEAFMLLVL